ncbi:MAG: UDP-N-acetylmuramate dehydrogenase [bacterium]
MLKNTLNIFSDIKKMVQKTTKDEPLSKYTSFCIGGAADVFVEVTTIEELRSILKYADSRNISILALGRGTNILVSDKGFRGIVLQLGEAFRGVDFKKDCAEAGSAAELPVLASKSFARGLSGLEFAVGIPGSVGGAVASNAGAYGKSMKDVVSELSIVDLQGKLHRVLKSDIMFSYRKAVFPFDGIITKVKVKLIPRDKNDIIGDVQLCIEKRKRTQGVSFPNAGCVFKNTDSCNSGKLIEDAGLKGLRVGGAQVSVKHANYIVNIGGATAEDVLCLIEQVRTKVMETSGVKLELEIKLVGE